MGTASKVTLAVADGVAIISLNRPDKHNAVDDELHEEFVATWAQVTADPAARVILLRGEGRSFCSGRDTAALGRDPSHDSALASIRAHQQFRQTELDTPKPVIAALHGHVLGGGLEIALAADIRIAATDTRLAFPEIRYGLMTDTGGAPLATMLAGPARAKWLLMTGTPIDANRALAWGLVDDVVAPGELDAVAGALAAAIATAPPDALAMIKQTVDGFWHGAVQAGMRAELLGMVALFGGPAYRARKPG